MVGKQGGGDPAKPPAEGKHTKTQSSQSTLLFLTQPWARSRAIRPYLHIYSLVPSSLGWALIQSKEEGKNSRCWQNLCCPWRAEAALRDRQASMGRWEPKQWCIGFSRQGRKVFSGVEIRNLPRSSGNKCKIKSLRVQPKGRAWCWCQQSCSPMSLEMRTCWFETGSCFQPNARAQKNPGMFNIPTLSS